MVNRYKILIVDDIAENIQILTRCYEDLHPDYILYQAVSAKSAIELVNNIKLDIVISDWDMPGMSGIELVKYIKDNPATAHIPVIIVTGVMLTPSDLSIALEAGAHDYLRKPVERNELVARTNSAIQSVLHHKKEIAVKNIELTEKSMLLAKSNEFNIELLRKLEIIERCFRGNMEALSLIREIRTDIDAKSKESNWGHFEIAFYNVYPDFCTSLIKKHPDLSPAEIKMCILVKLGMNNKEMASMLCISPDSIKVARSRMRKKLGMENDANLQMYLIQI